MWYISFNKLMSDEQWISFQHYNLEISCYSYAQKVTNDISQGKVCLYLNIKATISPLLATLVVHK